MKSAQKAHVLTLIVDNQFGVLTRITAQVRREGWNIKSLSVAECMDKELSRITLALVCFDTTLPAVIYRLSKLACVHTVTPYEADKHICRELVLFSLKTEKKDELDALIAEHGARCLSCEGCEFLMELVSEPGELDEFLSKASGLGEINAIRTGPIVMN